jgi:N-acetylmuramoyl-L-alanine amidase
MRRFALVIPLLVLGCSAQQAVPPSPTPQPAAVAAVVERPEPTATATPAPPLAGRRVCIDAGHDAVWAAGATARTSSGAVPVHPADRAPMHEHELTLSVAERLKLLLEAEGAAVCLTRQTRAEGGGVLDQPYDFNGDGVVRPTGRAIEDTPEVIQPRIDAANRFGAEVFISIHFNGSSDPSVRGSEAYFSDGVATAEHGRQLARDLLDGVLAAMAAAGHSVRDLGVKSDAYMRYSAAETQRLFATNRTAILTSGNDPAHCSDCYRLFSLGNNPMSRERGRYLAALLEVEFLSNPAVVEGFLLRPDSLDVIAGGLRDGLLRYFSAD